MFCLLLRVCNTYSISKCLSEQTRMDIDKMIMEQKMRCHMQSRFDIYNNLLRNNKDKGNDKNNENRK